MKWILRIKSVLLLSVFCSCIYAEEELAKAPSPQFDSTHTNWVFSGVVNNENGEPYGYFFQLQREKDKFHVITALFDGQTKKIILYDDSTAILNNENEYNWRVGASFLRFNPINDSWVFGMKTKDKSGFNFKVDMLSQDNAKPLAQNLRTGMELIISQTGHLNGHLRTDSKKEEFVTAKTAWFRQIWLSDKKSNAHPFSGVLCRFNDGSGFYSVNMHEVDAVRGAITGAYNAQGLATAISQFIQVKADPQGDWHIHISSPNRHWVLKDVVKQKSIVSGFISEKERFGFCMFSEDMLGEAAVS